MSRGSYEPYPLDFEVLRRLPPVGSMLGYHTLGATVKALKRELGEGVTSEQLHGRLRSMKVAGLVQDVLVLPAGDGKGWQITANGKALLARHGMGLAPVPEQEQREERTAEAPDEPPPPHGYHREVM